jgi:hypothetical protein
MACASINDGPIDTPTRSQCRGGFFAGVRMEKMGASRSIGKHSSGVRFGTEGACTIPSICIIFAIAMRRSSPSQIAVVVNMIEPLESLI